MEVTTRDHSVMTQIYALAQSAYALEARLIGCVDFPPLRSSWQDLQDSADRFLVFKEADRVLGALSFSCRNDTATITRLVVSPTHLRTGIGTALLLEFERQVTHVSRLEVSTAEANIPAVRLYQKLGYTICGTRGSLEGISIIQLNKFKRH